MGLQNKPKGKLASIASGAAKVAGAKKNIKNKVGKPKNKKTGGKGGGGLSHLGTKGRVSTGGVVRGPDNQNYQKVYDRSPK
jgi:hypothetical protein